MMIPIVLFAVGALFGLHILTHILKTKPTPKASIIIHGLLVATALIIVIISVVNGARGTIVTSMIFFIIAALGGAYLSYVDNVKKQPPPKSIAILHPILAVIGLVLLIIYAVSEK